MTIVKEMDNFVAVESIKSELDEVEIPVPSWMKVECEEQDPLAFTAAELEKLSEAGDRCLKPEVVFKVEDEHSSTPFDSCQIKSEGELHSELDLEEDVKEEEPSFCEVKTEMDSSTEEFTEEQDDDLETYNEEYKSSFTLSSSELQPSHQPEQNKIRSKFNMEDDKNSGSKSNNSKRKREDDEELKKGAENVDNNETNTDFHRKERAKMLARDRMRRYRESKKNKELPNEEELNRKKEASRKYSQNYRDKIKSKKIVDSKEIERKIKERIERKRELSKIYSKRYRDNMKAKTLVKTLQTLK